LIERDLDVERIELNISGMLSFPCRPKGLHVTRVTICMRDLGM
jgi:hypothetical protein